MTKIQWTERTWNPVTGCDKISPGCDHCYAERMAKRLAGRFGYPAEHPFRVSLHPDRLREPFRWRKPSRVFVNSMSDLFHRSVPQDFLLSVFGTMALCPQHTFQVLTKRPQRMRAFCQGLSWRWAGSDMTGSPTVPYWAPGDGEEPLANVWLGTSIELDRYSFRADHLRQTPAAVRFLSLEPLLGPLRSLDLTGVDWVIIGGESGPGARPMDLDWAVDLVARCRSAGAAPFVKQLGSAWAKEHHEFFGRGHDNLLGEPDGHGGNGVGWPSELRVREYPLVGLDRSRPTMLGSPTYTGNARHRMHGPGTV